MGRQVIVTQKRYKREFDGKKLEIVLGTERYENGKSGEGKSLQNLLYLLKDKGVIITLDALHCQKKQLTLS